MEWFWEVLGIEPTEEVYQIKRAYVERKRDLKRLEAKEDVNLKKYEELDNAEKMAVAYAEKKKDQSFATTGKEQDSSLDIHENKSLFDNIENVTEEVETEDIIELPQEKHEDVEITIERAESKEQFDRIEEELVEPEIVIEPKEIIEAEKTEPQEDTGNVLTEVHQLLEDWEQRREISRWEAIFDESDKWARTDFLKIQRDMEAIVDQQLIYLPKEIIEYLIEQLKLDDLEKGIGLNWSRKVADIPDFSFKLMEEVPENQAYLYFGKRYELYSLIYSSDWKTKTFEINEAIEFFEDEEDVFLFDPFEIDQDVINLLGIYTIKNNIKEVLVRNASSNFVDGFLLPYESDVSQERNKTAKFLRIIFTSIDDRTISLEESLYIENSQNSYVDDNLRELLVGCAFYHAKNFIKADKHFRQINGEYASMVKSMIGTKKTNIEQPKKASAPKKKKESKFGLGTIIKWIIIAVVIYQVLQAIFGIRGNIFGEDDEFNYFDEGTEEIEDNVESENVNAMLEVEPDEMARKFVLYFLAKGDNSEHQEEFIDEFVSEEGQDLFYDYQEKYDEIERKQEDHYFEVVMTTKSNEENMIIVENPEMVEGTFLLYLDEEEQIRNVVGKNWEELPADKVLKQAKALYMEPKDTVKTFVSDFLLTDVDQRAELLEENRFAYTSMMVNRMEKLLAVDTYTELEKGTCYFSPVVDLGYQVVVTNQEDTPVLMIDLDNYGRIWFISTLEGEDEDLWPGAATQDTMKTIKEIAKEKIKVSEL